MKPNPYLLIGIKIITGTAEREAAIEVLRDIQDQQPIFTFKAPPGTVDMPICPHSRAIASKKKSASRVAPSRPGSGESTPKMEQDQGGARTE